MSDSDQEPLLDVEQEKWEELLAKNFEDLTDEEITSKIRLSVKRRFSYPEWILQFEYGAPGQHGSVADAIALNTLPSRNFKIVGFEFKASRSDWLRELRKGSKADYFVQLCDEWYVVAGGTDVVDEEEVPKGWGLLEMKPNSEQLWKIKESNLTEHQQGGPSRRFWMKFINEEVGDETNYSKADLQEARARGFRDADDKLKKRANPDVDVKRLRKKAESWDKLRERFDVLSWYEISDEQLKTLELGYRLVKTVGSERFGNPQSTIEHCEKDIERQTERMQESVVYLREGLEVLERRVEEQGVPGAEEGRD